MKLHEMITDTIKKVGWKHISFDVHRKAEAGNY
jgi:hypothetical protein